ncbi:MAG: DUF4167 domain-containing protein [Pseudomonadota bacterium]
MNNNRNNRRRGRGNRNQGGGGNQLNRIDSRARGNAPQLLDKYKKLAQDAQHNGDRVQAEYYLQFADHYFRVIADNKARQEEARAKRNESRDPSFDDSEENDDAEGKRSDNRRGNRRGRGRRPDEETVEVEGEVGAEGEAVKSESDLENAGNDADAPERKPRRRRAAASKDEKRTPRSRKPKSDDAEPAEIDSSVLPPAIGADSSSTNDDGDTLETVN